MRDHRATWLFLTVASITLLASSIALADGSALKSRWNGGKDIVDGQWTGWENELVALPAVDAKIALCNDGRNLYIVMVTAERHMQARILAAGLSFWFDPTGRSQKTLGIRSPSCNRNVPLLAELRNGTLDDESFSREAAQASLTYEIMTNQGKNTSTIYAGQMDSVGIKSAFSFRDGQLIQEMRIPLTAGIFGKTPVDSAMGIVMESCKIDFGSMHASGEGSGQEDSGRHGGGMGGGGGMRGGGGGMGGGHGGKFRSGGGGHGGDPLSAGENHAGSVSLSLSILLAHALAANGQDSTQNGH